MGGKPEYCSAFPGSERTGVLPQILNAEQLTYFHGSLYEGMRAGVVVTRRGSCTDSNFRASKIRISWKMIRTGSPARLLTRRNLANIYLEGWICTNISTSNGGILSNGLRVVPQFLT